LQFPHLLGSSDHSAEPRQPKHHNAEEYERDVPRTTNPAVGSTGEEFSQWPNWGWGHVPFSRKALILLRELDLMLVKHTGGEHVDRDDNKNDARDQTDHLHEARGRSNLFPCLSSGSLLVGKHD